MTTTNLFARFPGASIQHLLREGTKTTLCGKDATLAHRYPALTRANSNDRRSSSSTQVTSSRSGATDPTA